jgi:hypothetical protein
MFSPRAPTAGPVIVEEEAPAPPLYQLTIAERMHRDPIRTLVNGPQKTLAAANNLCSWWIDIDDATEERRDLMFIQLAPDFIQLYEACTTRQGVWAKWIELSEENSKFKEAMDTLYSTSKDKQKILLLSSEP